MLAGLPYIEAPVLEIRPLDVRPFGILLALAVLAGAHLVRSLGQRDGLDRDSLQTSTAAAGLHRGAHRPAVRTGALRPRLLRATGDIRGGDPRYFGLTPGQFVTIGMMGLGLYLCEQRP
jgi:hypothetical protein